MATRMQELMGKMYDQKGARHAVEYVQEIATGSAEQFYALDYLTCRVLDLERPAACEYGVAVKVAEGLREQIDQRLPDGV